MNKITKICLIVLCVAALSVGAVFGTMAYLTDKDSAVNTLTIGSVQLTLDEAKVNTDGTVVKGADRVLKNEYHLLPGHTYTKDPTVTVKAGSTDAYVRMVVQIENIDKLMEALPNEGDTAKYYGKDGVFLLQMLCSGWDEASWKYVGYDKTTGSYEFRYKEVVAKSASATKLPALFESITIPGEIDGAHLSHLQDVNVVAQAHAIQASGFADANAAWAAFGK